jgi:hypothetical protein
MTTYWMVWVSISLILSTLLFFLVRELHFIRKTLVRYCSHIEKGRIVI